MLSDKDTSTSSPASSGDDVSPMPMLTTPVVGSTSTGASLLSTNTYVAPWNTTNSSKGGSSKHFKNITLPPRATRKSTAKNLTGKAGRIYKQSKRKGLSNSLTKRLGEKVKKKKIDSSPLTKEEEAMQEEDATLTSTNGARNHVVAAETSLVPYSSALSTLTDHSTSSLERDQAKAQTLRLAKALTGDDESVTNKVQALMDEVDSSDDSDDAAEVVGKLSGLTADHEHNVDIGHSGKNGAMSNRVDVTTSPGRTQMTSKDALILQNVRSPMLHLLGDDEDFTDSLLSIPMSPGGKHIMSSKQHQEKNSDSSDDDDL